VDALDGGALFFWGYEAHRDVDASDDEHSIFQFDFSPDISREFVIACIDLTRFQRASEGAHHSTGGSGDYVVDSGGVRFFNLVGRDFVVFGDCAVNAEDHRLRFARKMGDTQGTNFAFNLDV
jgi:hypothetical protein